MGVNSKKETILSIYKDLGENQEVLDGILDELISLLLEEKSPKDSRHISLDMIENLSIKISNNMLQIYQDLDRLRSKLDLLAAKGSISLPSKNKPTACEAGIPQH